MTNLNGVHPEDEIPIDLEISIEDAEMKSPRDR